MNPSPALKAWNQGKREGQLKRLAFRAMGLLPEVRVYKSYYIRRGQPRPGEITFKLWLLTESERQGVTPKAIYARIKSGKYSSIKKQMRYVNARVIYLPESVLTKEMK